jgi:predicted dehydrogenase
MVQLETEDGFVACPDSVAIIGGGRWARVLVDVLCEIVPPSVILSVHSLQNVEGMTGWVMSRGLGGRVEVSSGYPQSKANRPGAAIVANAARDHEAAAAWALSAGLPTLIEKPIATSFATAKRLADLARDRSVGIAAAHVFRFARYVENFSSLVSAAGRVALLRVDWTDPELEQRYGESKRYDSTLPVFADCLPHVLSIVRTLLPSFPDTCRELAVRRGGAEVELNLIADGVSCFVHLERNAKARRRVVETGAGPGGYRLDFSMEPGMIHAGSSDGIIADENWQSRQRPVARMLTAFLNYAGGGALDPRLDFEPGLQACGLIDQVSGIYRTALRSWLVARLAEHHSVDGDLRYALSELLQAEGSLPGFEVDRQIDRVAARFFGTDASQWLGELRRSTDAAGLLKALAA